MSSDRDVIKQHNSWLTLIEASGPFLSIPVLKEAFPHGLDQPSDEAERRRRLRLAYDEWADNQHGNRPEVAIHTQWVRFVLEEVLGMRPDAILEGQRIPPDLCYTTREYETVRPALVIRSPYEPQPRLLIQLYPHTQNLKKTVPGTATVPDTRMMELLHATNIRLGLVTNGEQWMLVDAPRGEPAGYYSWYANLWLDEPITLRAFRSLLSMERFFNVPEDERLEALLTKSATRQQEVTTQLGDQVRRAIEVLVQTLDRLDKDSQRVLLHNVDEKTLYDAALTVMMRLVFLLFAEERELLQLDNPLYADNYAVSTMHKQLREQADQHGEEVLGLRHDAWSRLLALFRLVFGGAFYHDLYVPAYGGRLFNPYRFPFLEGRSNNALWNDTPVQPLPIDNRTVLHLLNALQYLQIKVQGGGTEARRISFKSLDVEQIGHVYEGLLEHTTKRASTAILGLVGKSDAEPEATLTELEQYANKGQPQLLTFLQERTARSTVALQKLLTVALDDQQRSRLMEACDNRQHLFERVLPFAGLLRRDSFGNFVLVTPGSVYVTKGADRRSTGTHYTPRSLTEPLVQHALDPLVYIGPAEGLPESAWQLRPVADLLKLKVCDMAMGSGAFLVQSCRYLSEKLVAAWEHIEQEYMATHPSDARKPLVLPDCHPSQGDPGEELLPIDREERLAVARRIISERCLYGVDKNPMAVEMAKLSLWLITLAKNRPFTFLDHALRSGDSLLGTNLKQLTEWSLAPQGPIRQTVWIEPAIKRAVDVALKLRQQISTMPGRTARDIDQKAIMLFKAESAMDILKLGADLLVATALIEDPKRRGLIADTLHMEYFLLLNRFEQAQEIRYHTAIWGADEDEYNRLRAEVDKLLYGRRFFHWPLEFPEVFANHADGFDAIMSNPPFQGGKKITGVLGTDYRDYLLEYLAHGKRGNADLCAYFFLRATSLVRANGTVALLATNTIAQGDTREVGLDQIVASGWSIPRAIPSRKWPGEASLEVAHIWLRNGKWKGPYILNDIATSGITAFLTQPGKILGNPYVLEANKDKSFQGSVVLGMGFILEPEQARVLIAKDPRNKDVLFPYLNGEDLNTHPDQSPSRWVINFHERSLQDAETYKECIDIVRKKVIPQREAASKFARKEWWLHHRSRPELYSTIANMKRVLVRAQVSKTWGWVFVPNGWVYDAKTIVFAFDRYIEFTILQSTFHWEWSIQYGTTLRLDMSYTPTRNFETFPFPTHTGSLDDIGECYYTYRQSIMQARQEGLTKTYNRFHDERERVADIVRLRELHREMDEAVACAYGWDDLRLEHDFHETKQGIRYTISEAARREVLDRLLLLNHQRHAEEVSEGVTAKKGSKGKGKSGKNGRQGQEKLHNGQRHGMLASMGGVEEISGDVRQETLFE